MCGRLKEENSWRNEYDKEKRNEERR